MKITIINNDYRSTLDNHCRKAYNQPLLAFVVKREGSTNKPTFTVRVILPNGEVYFGLGSRINTAIQDTCKLILEKYKLI